MADGELTLNVYFNKSEAEVDRADMNNNFGIPFSTTKIVRLKLDDGKRQK
jgi:hypothetical protein